MGKLAFNRLLNIQKCLLEIADLRMRAIAKQTLYTCGCGANEFNFRCGFALCGAKIIFATPSTGQSGLEDDQGPGSAITPSTWLGPVLAWSQQSYQR